MIGFEIEDDKANYPFTHIPRTIRILNFPRSVMKTHLHVFFQK